MRSATAILRCAILCLVLSACGDDDGGSQSTVDGGIGVLQFGQTCTESTQCQSNACVPVSDERAVCSGSCVDARDCPPGPNWVCAPIAGHEPSACACAETSDVEICDDQIDNDCDGLVDDCPPVEVDASVDAATPDVPMDACVADPTLCEPPPPADPCEVEPALCPACRTNADCDDDNPCTRDECRARGCVHKPSDADCAAGEVCDLRQGCVAARACAVDADCADEDACTRNERCDPSAKLCRFTLLDGDQDERYPEVCGGNDCNDNDPTVFHGALDVCDGRDNDCNGSIDPPSAALGCGPDRVCWEGACLCDADHVACRGRCFVPDAFMTDDFNCGACGTVCGGGTRCVAGECENIDECVETPAICGAHSTCSDAMPGYDCTCDSGYSSFSGAECSDIDECLGVANTCDDLPDACVNTDGAFMCTCPSGYVGDGIGAQGCLDRDECTLGTQTCDAALRCVNVAGGCRRAGRRRRGLAARAALADAADARARAVVRARRGPRRRDRPGGCGTRAGAVGGERHLRGSGDRAGRGRVSRSRRRCVARGGARRREPARAVVGPARARTGRGSSLRLREPTAGADANMRGRATGVPLPPPHPSLRRTGAVFIALETLPDTSERLGELLAHEAAHALGLRHTSELDGVGHDAIADTAQCPPSRASRVTAQGQLVLAAEDCADLDGANLMFWTAPVSESAQRELTPDQGAVLRLYPGVLHDGSRAARDASR